jgi:hypothetical protein
MRALDSESPGTYKHGTNSGPSKVALLLGKIAELKVDVPEYQRPPEVDTLDQHWTEAQGKRFYPTPQGTLQGSCEWLEALALVSTGRESS